MVFQTLATPNTRAPIQARATTNTSTATINAVDKQPIVLEPALASNKGTRRPRAVVGYER